MRKSIGISVFTSLLAPWALLACSKASPLEARVDGNWEIMAPAGGYALGGYDPVSYFRDGAPRKGAAEFSHRWRDATWLFATSEHRGLFEQNPSKYAPEYGGWCAYGMAEGYPAESDPVNAWTIHEGKLYLNWSAEVAEEWRADLHRLLPQSESNWSKQKRSLQEGTAKIYWHDDED